MHQEAIYEYFQKVSCSYAESSNKGIWKYIRRLEERAVIKAFGNNVNYLSALDFGSGTGHYSRVLSGLGLDRLVCVDFSKNMLDKIEMDCEKVLSSIEAYKGDPQGEEFDLILCAGALEFSSEPTRVFENISNLLDPAGRFIVLLPRRTIFGLFYFLYHRLHGFRVRLFTKQAVEAMATKFNCCLFSWESIPLLGVVAVIKSRPKDSSNSIS